MPTSSPRTHWVQAPASNVALVLVDSNSMPQPLASALRHAVEGWEQVAYLHIDDADGLQRDWLDAENQSQGLSAKSEIGTVLQTLPHHCVLLDLEQNHSGQLTWLGSVCGHSLRYIELQSGADDSDAQLRRILDTAQQLVKQQLQAHFSMC